MSIYVIVEKKIEKLLFIKKVKYESPRIAYNTYEAAKIHVDKLKENLDSEYFQYEIEEIELVQ